MPHFFNNRFITQILPISEQFEFLEQKIVHRCDRCNFDDLNIRFLTQTASFSQLIHPMKQ